MSESPTATAEATAEAAAAEAAEAARALLAALPSLWSTLDHAQTFHGVPSGDYAQYRQYCTQRLRRIRHHKDVRTLLTHSTKYQASSGTGKHSKNASSNANSNATSTNGGTAGRGTKKRNAYCPRSLPDNHLPRHPYVLYNMLFQAERAWAHAQAATMAGQQEGYSPKTAPRRFRKAVQHAQRLAATLDNLAAAAAAATADTAAAADTATSRATSATSESSGSTAPRTAQVEGRAYLAWMQGNQALHLQNYARAGQHYASCRKLLRQLVQRYANGAGGSTDGTNDTNTKETPQKQQQQQQQQQQQMDQMATSDVLQTRSETVLKPLIRFCQYEARSDANMAWLDDENEEKTSNTAASSSSAALTLEFRHKVVHLDAYPQLAVLYLRMQEEGLREGRLLSNGATARDDKNLTTSKVPQEETAFLQLLADLDDALGLVATESARYAALPAGPSVSAKRTELATLKGYFTYHKLKLQRQHQEDTLLIGVTEDEVQSEPDDAGLFHFYDALWQNAQAMADLAIEDNGPEGGTTHVEDDYNPEDDPHWLEAQAHVVRIRAFRCYYLARVYEHVLHAPTTEVLALLHQARILQRRAAEEVAACELEDYLPALQVLQQNLSVFQCRVEATRCLELAGASTGVQTTQRPLWQRVNELDAGPVLADDPPVPIPLPCKPVFYDLAGVLLSERIALDPLDEFIQDAEPPKSKSLFRWFS